MGEVYLSASLCAAGLRATTPYKCNPEVAVTNGAWKRRPAKPYPTTTTCVSWPSISVYVFGAVCNTSLAPLYPNNTHYDRPQQDPIGASGVLVCFGGFVVLFFVEGKNIHKREKDK
jgi:hypothetical protein